MDFKTIMNNMIEDEISKLEQTGERVRLKTLSKKRIRYTLIFGAIFLILMASDSLFLAFVDMVIYYILMYNTNNASIITKLSKNSPDTPVSEIIRGDMK